MVQGQYYVTGQLTRSAFTEDCVFIDPTTNVAGVERYTTAVAALFDADASKAELISLEVSLTKRPGAYRIPRWWGLDLTVGYPLAHPLGTLQVEDPRTILLRWRLEGVLRLGGLAIKPYTGTTR